MTPADTGDRVDHDEKPCGVCGETVTIDGVEATERFGQVLCQGCCAEPVVFEAECQAAFCGWTRRFEDTEFNRGHVKQLAQQEANHHETTRREFDGEHEHQTTVSELQETTA